MSDLDSIKSALKKLSPADREEISRLTGFDLGEDGSSNPLESKPDKFYWISFLLAIIAPWVFLIWMRVDMNMVLLGAACGIWSVYMIRGWLREYERRERIEAQAYDDEADDDREDG